ncbi:hypothetical protein DL93DRAFT_2090478 [Clavulina sp. PMI_390]|nr:hypothetical protein DL93DRAFT_2090478 [Clavulina sp. PMI_390]
MGRQANTVRVRGAGREPVLSADVGTGSVNQVWRKNALTHGLRTQDVSFTITLRLRQFFSVLQGSCCSIGTYACLFTVIAHDTIITAVLFPVLHLCQLIVLAGCPY